MTGFLRILLAATVVLYHVGGLQRLAGHGAVFGFFVISGFLITAALDRTYVKNAGFFSGAALARFYGNRFLRIWPLYAVYVVLSIVIFRHAQESALVASQSGDIATILAAAERMTGDVLKGDALFAPHFSFDPFVLRGSPNVIPQGWSLLTELCFYAIAPLLFLSLRGRGILLGAGIAVSLILMKVYWWSFTDFTTLVYKNVPTSLWIFGVGMIAYVASTRLPDNAMAWRGPVFWGAILTITGLFAVVDKTGFAISIFAVILLIALAMIAAARPSAAWGASRGPLDAVGTYLGDLSYAVYLNHFIAAALVLKLNAWLFAMTGTFEVFGSFGSLRFGLNCLWISLLLAVLTHWLIERRLEGVRARVRQGGSPIPTATPVGMRASSAAIALVAVFFTITGLVTQPRSLAQSTLSGDADAVRSFARTVTDFDYAAPVRLDVSDPLGPLDEATPLMAAAYVGKIEILEFLISAGADPTAPQNAKAICLSIAQRHSSATLFLLRYGADPQTECGDTGLSARMLAEVMGEDTLLDKMDRGG